MSGNLVLSSCNFYWNDAKARRSSNVTIERKRNWIYRIDRCVRFVDNTRSDRQLCCPGPVWRVYQWHASGRFAFGVANRSESAMLRRFPWLSSRWRCSSRRGRTQAASRRASRLEGDAIWLVTIALSRDGRVSRPRFFAICALSRGEIV